MESFSLEVSYAQIAVFDSNLANPFNDWTDGHVGQGFCWRPGSVSFATLGPAGKIIVRVTQASADDFGAARAERIIAVPFSVPIHGILEVASITGSVTLKLPSGEYELTFTHGRDPDGGMWATLNFRAVDEPTKPRIVLADPALSPPPELIMTAEPA